jgi:hypothetical protein
MSLLNAWISPTAAIVAVDTDGVGQDGARMPSSKLLPIPHLNAVLALRGQSALLSFVFVRCISSGFETFDQLADALPAMLIEAEDSVDDEHLVDGPQIGNELLAVGWSDRKGQMAGRQFVKRGDMTEFSETDAAFHVSPWHASLQRQKIEPQALDQIARAQVRWMRETFPNAACGGTLVVCSLNRKAMGLTHKFNFEDARKAA